ncbi:WD40-repeat-containing domain protein [Aspergillus granulosus]|uniref:WD40-repeat-containing domain protein n=1 Tax=Aspergillus granulosus TaxID=176169 RepID=A0ABR4GU14_9EURO
MFNLPSVDGAFSDSFTDQHEDECLPGTRTELLQQVMDWGRSSDKCIFWLSGMAGTGKSTIARTVARLFKEDSILGASFFFRRGEGGQGSATKFSPTIVKQLAVHIPQMTTGIEKAIGDDPAITAKSLREQFDKLMLQPLLAVDQDQAIASTVIVIDALDECDREEDVEIILELLTKSHPFAPLFIFAATVCRFVADRKWNPEKRLQQFFEDSPGSKMDKTYRPILNQLSDDDERGMDTLVEEFQKIIGVIITLAAPLSLTALAELIEVPEDNISIQLDSFHSVLTVPYDPDIPIRTLHLSFRDYLMDERTKANESTSRFWVDKGEKHELITRQCVTAMGRLRKNICNLPSYGTSRTEIDPDSVTEFLPPTLQLESMSILGIVSESVNAVDTLLQLTKDTTNNELFYFLSDARRFILKVINIITTAPLQLYSAGVLFAPQESLIRRKFEKELPGWLSTAPRVDENWGPELQTLEGHSRSVRSITFSPDGRLLASGSRDGTIKLWNPATGGITHTLDSCSDLVLSVTFSPDGRLLASGSIDRTIKLWDPATGNIKHILESRSNSDLSVTFSPDCKLLASGSDDGTIKLWDPTTGSIKHTLEGHSASVQSVTFSPDGRLLASGSSDETIKLWDPATGSIKHTLEGHSHWVRSVTFSPDGRLLASGSNDRTIKLWDPATGSIKYILEGHSDWVQSVTF